MFNENNNEDENCLRVIIILTQTRQTFAEYSYIAIARMCRPDGSEGEGEEPFCVSQRSPRAVNIE